MNPQRAKDLLPTITAFAEGKKIEMLHSTSRRWEPVSEPRWADGTDYRVAAEPGQVLFDLCYPPGKHRLDWSQAQQSFWNDVASKFLEVMKGKA